MKFIKFYHLFLRLDKIECVEIEPEDFDLIITMSKSVKFIEFDTLEQANKAFRELIEIIKNIKN